MFFASHSDPSNTERDSKSKKGRNKMEQNYYQKDIETMSREDMKKLQSEKLVKQVKHVYENVPYYRDLMDKKGVKPEDIHGIEDLCKLPFLSKADLRDAYPTDFSQSP